MTKKYPIILYPVEENGASSYSVLIPDFPGCVSHGDSEQDALENARAALDLHVQALIESGQTIAEPSTVDQVKDESEPGAIYALVELPLSEVREMALARKKNEHSDCMVRRRSTVRFRKGAPVRAGHCQFFAIDFEQ